MGRLRNSGHSSLIFGMALMISSCSIFAPEEERKVRTVLEQSGIEYERLQRSFETGEQYSYRLTVKDGYSVAEVILVAMEAWHPKSENSSLVITDANYETAATFVGGGDEDIAETRKLSEFLISNKDTISRLHYTEPQEEPSLGANLRLVVEYRGELNAESIEQHIRTASEMTGGTILSFNQNKITIIGEPALDERDKLAQSLFAIYETIEKVSPEAEEYDYNINAKTETKEIRITKSISDEATLTKNELLEVPVPEKWKISF